MKVLIIGSYGQLGRELTYTKPAKIALYAEDIDSLDITDREQVNKKISDICPDVVINAAAYTAVDKAESDREIAFLVNESGPGNIAKACRISGSRFIHVSTDFIFNGNASSPYMPDDSADPLGVYGESKYKGEKAVLRETEGDALIFRTAWVYSSHGGNFVKTMLRLMKEKDHLGVIYDQVGSPTWARTLAKTIWKAVLSFPELNGVYHWTDSGVASWYDFAAAIQEEALAIGLLDKKIPLMPIRTSEYPTPAKRPAYSVLDCSKTWKDLSLSPKHWRLSLKKMLKGLNS